MMLKSSVAYILYNYFDKSQIKSIDFLKYCRLINEFDISNKIFREISKYKLLTVVSFSHKKVDTQNALGSSWKNRSRKDLLLGRCCG